MKIYGEAHDATHVRVKGFSCWIASIVDERGNLKYDNGRAMHNVHEAANETEAMAWLRERAASMGAQLYMMPKGAGTWKLVFDPSLRQKRQKSATCPKCDTKFDLQPSLSQKRQAQPKERTE